MFCGNCGSQLNETASFCPNCGHKIIRSDVAGAPVDADRGASQAALDKTLEDNSVERPLIAGIEEGQPKKRRSIAVYAIAAAVVLVVAVVFVANMGDSDSGNAGQNARPATNASVQRKREPANLEEYLAAMDSDYPDRLRNSLLKGTSLINALDVKVGVSKNQVNIVIIANAKSSDQGLLGSLISTYSDDAFDYLTEGESLRPYSEVAAQLQKESGFPVRVHLETRYSDGPLINSYDFSAAGRLD